MGGLLRDWSGTAAILAMGFLLATASAQQPRQASDFRQRPLGSGEEVVLNQLRGKEVVLLFWTNW